MLPRNRKRRRWRIQSYQFYLRFCGILNENIVGAKITCIKDRIVKANTSPYYGVSGGLIAVVSLPTPEWWYDGGHKDSSLADCFHDRSPLLVRSILSSVLL